MGVWVIYLRVKSQQIKFDDTFRAENAMSRVPLSYQDARNQVANWRLTFRGFKIKNTVLVMF